jgi:hypothetical protein
LNKYNIPCYFSGCLTLALGEKYKTIKKRNYVIFVDPFLASIHNKNKFSSFLKPLKTV